MREVHSSKAMQTTVLIFKDKELEKECTISTLVSFYYYYQKENKYLKLDQKGMRYSNERKAVS